MLLNVLSVLIIHASIICFMERNSARFFVFSFSQCLAECSLAFSAQIALVHCCLHSSLPLIATVHFTKSSCVLLLFIILIYYNNLLRFAFEPLVFNTLLTNATKYELTCFHRRLYVHLLLIIPTLEASSRYVIIVWRVTPCRNRVSTVPCRREPKKAEDSRRKPKKTEVSRANKREECLYFVAPQRLATHFTRLAQQ
jgi:hypothetical protein